MDKDHIIITILSIIITIILCANIIYFSLKSRHNNKTQGAYIFNTNNIDTPASDSTRIDNHVKYLMDTICKEKNIKGSSKNNVEYIDDEILHRKAKHLLDFPKVFQPDYVIELDNRYIIIEFDEGDNFHSNNTDINYIKKWLNYNNMIINDNYGDKPVIIVRITYKNGFKFEDAENNIVRNIITFIITSGIVGCYYLYRFGYNLKKIPKSMVDRNKEQSAKQYYEQQTSIIKHGKYMQQSGGFNNTDSDNEDDNICEKFNNLKDILSYKIKNYYLKDDVGMIISDNCVDESFTYKNVFMRFQNEIFIDCMGINNLDNIDSYNTFVNNKFPIYLLYIKHSYDIEEIKVYVNIMVLALLSIKNGMGIVTYQGVDIENGRKLHANILNEPIVKDFLNEYQQYFIEDIGKLFN